MKIGVIMGGVSSERAVSLKTGKAMVEVLKSKNYDVCEIIIDKESDIFDIPEIDFALLALHGKYGEDGTLQNYFELKGIPYSGCNAVSSALCMDKNLTKKILKASDVPTANWVTVTELADEQIEKAMNLSYPVFVKPASGGSSVGTFKVNDKNDLVPALTEALKWDREVMVEEFLQGYEITCAMIDGEVLPIVRIDATGEFFDFESKYNDNGANEYAITLPTDLHDKVVKICKDTWKALGCQVYARVDIIIDGDKCDVLEVNTLPGMTPNSLFPKSCAAAGITMEELLDKVINLSLKCRQK